ncbi:MAG: site-specific integrase [Oscillospiraceae bacterium]|nr:site-specific integrase [Oscillospiraceae bacterium]
MASHKLMETKDGRRFYQIAVSRGYGLTPYTTRWYIPDGWSKRAIDRELRKVSAEFELRCSGGEVMTRREKKAAEAAEMAAAAQIKTVRQYADGVFMPTKEATLSENARDNYRMMLDKHILPVLGEALMVEVNPAAVQKLLIDFQRRGYAHATTVKLYNILNGVFTMAYMDDTIPVNPMLKVKRPAPRKDELQERDTDKAYTAKELALILSSVEHEPLKWRAYITLAADSGARRGELCGLQWKDIDFPGGTITISRNLQYTKAAGIYATSPKNGKTRRVDVGADTIALLRSLREEQAADCLSQWVFTQDGTSDPMHPQSPTRYFKRFGERYGIADFHPHKLRHSSASIAITNGADVVSVSERLGHSDTAVTLRMYAHANEESIRRAGQIVRDALKASSE